MDRNVNTCSYRKSDGELIAVKAKFKARFLSVLTDNIEQLFVVVSVRNENFILGEIYIPLAI